MTFETVLKNIYCILRYIKSVKYLITCILNPYIGERCYLFHSVERCIFISFTIILVNISWYIIDSYIRRIQM